MENVSAFRSKNRVLHILQTVCVSMGISPSEAAISKEKVGEESLLAHILVDV